MIGSESEGESEGEGGGEGGGGRGGGGEVEGEGERDREKERKGDIMFKPMRTPFGSTQYNEYFKNSMIFHFRIQNKKSCDILTRKGIHSSWCKISCFLNIATCI